MSQLLIRDALLSNLTFNTLLPIAFENSAKPFDPKGLDSYIAQYFLPNITTSRGKAISSGDESIGIYQISVYIRAMGDYYDNPALMEIDSLRKAFYIGAVFDGVRVTGLSQSNGTVQNGWFKIDLSINFSSYTER